MNFTYIRLHGGHLSWGAGSEVRKSLAVISVSRVNSLPKWSAPKNLGEAALTISQLGRNMHEHAYLVGKTLLWVKKEVGHGKFVLWLKTNVWFGHVTATHMMKFATTCINAGEVSEYHGHRTKKYLPGKHLSTQKREKNEHDPRPPESRLFFDVAHRIEESFSSLSQEQKRDFVETMQDLIRQLEKRIEETNS